MEGETKVVSQELLDKIEALAFNPEGATYIDFLLPDGTTETRIQVEGDIALSEEYINTMNILILRSLINTVIHC